MKVGINSAALKQNRLQDYLVRFIFGGLITSVAGIIAQKYGPVVGGLFLAFPAILPASLSLVERHEDQKRRDQGSRKRTPTDAGHDGRRLGPKAAGVCSAGAALGSIGMLAFGSVVWLLAPRLPAWQALSLALLAWGTVSILLWMAHKNK